MSAPYILLCAAFFREPGGGAATGGLLSNFHLVRALAMRHDVRVLSLDPRPPSGAAARETGYRVMSAPARSYAPGLNYLFWKRDVLSALGSAVREWGEPAVLMAGSATSLVLGKARSPARKVAVVRAYENFGLSVPEGTPGERLAAFKNELKQQVPQRRLLADADMVITNSRYMAGEVERVFGVRRCEVLYPCIDLIPPPRLPRGEGVGFVNRGGAKGLDLVVELARRMPDVAFKVFGSAAVEAPPANLSLMGWCDDRSAMFGSAAVWIAPSQWNEPFGRVGAEAQAFGRQVIVSRRGGLPEAVSEPAVVIDGFDPDVWTRAVREALARPLEEAEAAAVSRRVLERFGAETHDARALEIFAGLMP